MVDGQRLLFDVRGRLCGRNPAPGSTSTVLECGHAGLVANQLCLLEQVAEYNFLLSLGPGPSEEGGRGGAMGRTVHSGGSRQPEAKAEDDMKEEADLRREEEEDDLPLSILPPASRSAGVPRP